MRRLRKVSLVCSNVSPVYPVSSLLVTGHPSSLSDLVHSVSSLCARSSLISSFSGLSETLATLKRGHRTKDHELL